MACTSDPEPFRRQVDAAISQGEWTEARAALEDLWRERPTSATAACVISRFQTLREHFRLRLFRVAILRSFTVEPAAPLVRAAALFAGIDLDLRLSPHNAYAQEVLNPGSDLYSKPTDAVILAVQLRDIAPALWNDFAALGAEAAETAVEDVAGAYWDMVRAFRSHSDAALILHLFEQPAVASQGILDSQRTNSQTESIQRLNTRIRQLAREHTGVFVLDYDALVSRHGRERWHDEQKWLTVRLPIGAEFLNALACEWLRFFHPLCGRTAKVLVTDLDNTLWGGVIGEDGLAGIQLDGEYPGAAYRALQQAMLDLHRRGVLLAIASKNNEGDAMQVFQHRGMLLKPDHFAAMRINWRDKADSIREIAQELNVGLDSFVFLDDNPVERHRMRRELPEVTVIELPSDPMRYASTLRDAPMFERLALSAEDSQRQQFYAQQRQRMELRSSSASLEGFYRSLHQIVEIEPLKAQDMTRVVQLLHKTNQFNLTTRRHSEAQLARFASSPDWDVYSVRVLDKFGDNGLVGVCIANRLGETCDIDTLLLSCRVIGRSVESAILFFLARQCRAQGIEVLRGRFVPTAKNQPAASFYADHGFERISQDDNGVVWSLNLETARLQCPDWIELRTQREVALAV